MIMTKDVIFMIWLETFQSGQQRHMLMKKIHAHIEEDGIHGQKEKQRIGLLEIYQICIMVV